jgi:cell wall-associated NlpC family hydrolase
MSGAAWSFAAAAEGLVGTPFRFRGRDAATGLDCVGLVAAALRASGRAVPTVPAYSMRQGKFSEQLGSALLAGFVETGGATEAGDLLLVRAGPGQVHLLVAGTTGDLIHAHAGLGRVVATPPPCPWPIERHWRLQAD